MKCNACGFEFEGKFCTNCGTPVGQAPAVKTTTNVQVAQTRPLYNYHLVHHIIRIKHNTYLELDQSDYFQNCILTTDVMPVSW